MLRTASSSDFYKRIHKLPDRIISELVLLFHGFTPFQDEDDEDADDNDDDGDDGADG